MMVIAVRDALPDVHPQRDSYFLLHSRLTNNREGSPRARVGLVVVPCIGDHFEHGLLKGFTVCELRIALRDREHSGHQLRCGSIQDVPVRGYN